MELPEPIGEHLKSLFVRSQFPAYLFVSHDGVLLEWGGGCDRYGLTPLESGVLASDQIDFLEGMLPLEEGWFQLPRLLVHDFRVVDVHFVPGEEGDWVVLLDTTEAANRETVAQQQANDLALLKLDHLKMLAQLRAHNENMRAVLNQLRLTTAVIAEDGGVLFLSRSGLDLLHADKANVEGSNWREVFRFSDADAEQFAQLLEVPRASRERLRLELKMATGRMRSFDIDIQSDPRDPAQRIAYFYDISDLLDLRNKLHEKARFQDMVGKSHPMRQVFQIIEEVARVDATVLVEGETGTGKELVARAIHYSSPRQAGPFIVVNCAGLADSLINSQLFGHKKGSFTDAVTDQKGVFEAAHGGTILLDEIGDIPMNTQTRILRALEQREIVRVGETQPRKVDIRILAATNKNLETEVKQGNFRLDLLYRIRIARVTLPPLRERREDVPLLVEAFAHDICVEYGLEIPHVERDVLSALIAYRWPGNVRELRNAVEFALIRCKEAKLRLVDLPPELTAAGNVGGSASSTDSDKERILSALKASKGRRAAAAKLLGISRATLYRRMKACCLGDDVL
ncbi:MAG: sigma 54-interacting transcriptional regulator [Verrucomicrobia bacterium]|jgi:sigma-54 dependent transcriptional regulator, acetoin dehydrogenase operon transcriptional activator AcoR|nr:sigma 54-interacting transcriptional regulator [Verrucomicrobiota bacterium]